MRIEALLVLEDSPASGYQVKDQNDHGYYEQNMNQAPRNVKAESK